MGNHDSTVVWRREWALTMRPTYALLVARGVTTCGAAHLGNARRLGWCHHWRRLCGTRGGVTAETAYTCSTHRDGQDTAEGVHGPCTRMRLSMRLGQRVYGARNGLGEGARYAIVSCTPTLTLA